MRNFRCDLTRFPLLPKCGRYFCLLENVKHLLSLDLRPMWQYILRVLLPCVLQIKAIVLAIIGSARSSIEGSSWSNGALSVAKWPDSTLAPQPTAATEQVL